MLWYITVCSLIGGLSVSCIQGVGTAFVQTAMGNNQFKHWFTYFLLIFVTVTLLVEIYYLNIALALFNTAMVTPTYYVIFTGSTLITSVVLYQGLKASVTAIITVVMGFFVICAGIIILQMSRVDPEELGKLDRRSTLLLKAAHSTTGDPEKSTLSVVEDPGMDVLRGFGAVGSIIRARSSRRLSMNSSTSRARHSGNDMEFENSNIAGRTPSNRLSTQGLDHLTRHQLYDSPVRKGTVKEGSANDNIDGLPRPLFPQTTGTPEHRTIKFGEEATAHYYPTAGRSGEAVHEQQFVNHSASGPQATAYPGGAKAPTSPGAKTHNTGDSGSSYFDPYSTVSIGGGTATVKKTPIVSGIPEVAEPSQFAPDSIYAPRTASTPTTARPQPFRPFQLENQSNSNVATSSPRPARGSALPQHSGIPMGHNGSIDSLASQDSFDASRDILLAGKHYPGTDENREELVGLVHHSQPRRGGNRARNDTGSSSNDDSDDRHPSPAALNTSSPGAIRLVTRPRSDAEDSASSRRGGRF